MYRAFECRMSLTVVNDAAGQRSKRSVVVFDRGRCEIAGSSLPVEIKRVAPLINAPADVVARLDQVGEFPQVLAVVSYPQVAGLGVNGHPPRIAVPERPDFAARLSISGTGCPAGWRTSFRPLDDRRRFAEFCRADCLRLER